MKNFSINHQILLIIILGILLRIITAITSNALWFDEIASVMLAKNSFGEMWKYLLYENNPPIYFWLLHLWGNLFHWNEIALRMLSVVISAPSFLGIYLLSKEFFNNNKSAQISTFIFSFSVFAVYYASDVRVYSLIFLSTTFSLYHLIRLHKTKNPNHLIAFFVWNLVAFNTSITTWILIPIYLIQILYWVKKDQLPIKFLIVSLLSFLTPLPWLIFYSTGFIINSDVSNLNNSWYIQRMPNTPYFLDFINHTLFNQYIPFSFLSFTSIPIAIGIVSFTKKSIKSKVPYSFLLLSIILFPLTLNAILTNLSVVKYFIPSAIGIYILLGNLLSILISKIFSKTIVLSLSIIILGFSTTLISINTNYRSPQINIIKFLKYNKSNTVITNPVGLALLQYDNNELNFIITSPLRTPNNNLDMLQKMLRLNWIHNSENNLNIEDYLHKKNFFTNSISEEKSSVALIIHRHSYYSDKLHQQILEELGYKCQEGKYFQSINERKIVLIMSKYIPQANPECLITSNKKLRN